MPPPQLHPRIQNEVKTPLGLSRNHLPPYSHSWLGISPGAINNEPVESCLPLRQDNPMHVSIALAHLEPHTMLFTYYHPELSSLLHKNLGDHVGDDLFLSNLPHLPKTWCPSSPLSFAQTFQFVHKSAIFLLPPHLSLLFLPSLWQTHRGTVYHSKEPAEFFTPNETRCNPPS